MKKHIGPNLIWALGMILSGASALVIHFSDHMDLKQVVNEELDKRLETDENDEEA
jgi:hypothetical protein